MNIIEIWKISSELNNKYEVSNLGNIRYNQKNLKTSLYSLGYPSVYIKELGHSIFLHIFIARAFIPNPENKPCVNHKNGIRNDNRVENLEWCTHKENIQHAVLTGLFKPACGEKNGKSKLLESDIITILLSTKSSYELSEIFKVNSRHIRAIREGRYWKNVYDNLKDLGFKLYESNYDFKTRKKASKIRRRFT